MRKYTVTTIAFLAAALATGAQGIATNALARGGLGGGGHSHGMGGIGGPGSFSAGSAPSVLPTPLTPNSGLSRDIQGLNFNRQTRNRERPVRAAPTRPVPATPRPSFERQLDRMNRQPGSVTLP